MEDQKNECEQVVKAFECCRHNEEENTCKYCKECPAGTWELAEEELNCIQSVYVRAAALINRQKAEIDRLSVELKAMRGAANFYKEKANSEDERLENALADKARECNIAVDKICIAHREEIRALQEKHEAELAADAIQVAREVFWEIDMLLTAIYLDDEDGTHFVGVDIQKYHALRKEIHEKLKTERTKRNESKNRI